MKTWMFILIVICSVPNALGQGPQLSVNLGGGYTFYPQSQAFSDQVVNYGGHFQYYFLQKRNFSFGLQMGHQSLIGKVKLQHFQWGSSYQGYNDSGYIIIGDTIDGNVEISYVPGNPSEVGPVTEQELIYRSQYIPIFILGRITSPSGWFAELALGTHNYYRKYDNRTSLSIMPALGLGAGYNIKLNDQVSFPLKIQSNLEHSVHFNFYNRLWDGILSVTGTAGLAYTFK